jgi:hypothetical protein
LMDAKRRLLVSCSGGWASPAANLSSRVAGNWPHPKDITDSPATVKVAFFSPHWVTPIPPS